MSSDGVDLSPDTPWGRSITDDEFAKMVETGRLSKRARADYWAYYHDRCRKFAPRYRDWDNHAYEDVLALLMVDHPEKTEVDCVIALAKMQLYAPALSSKSRTG